MRTTRRDMVVLAADKDMQHGLRGLFARHEALGVRPFDVEIFVHVERDPGCFSKGHDFLRPFVNQFGSALVIFDRHGCGREHAPREELERLVESRLAANGWSGRSCAIAVDPELEVWCWVDSPHLDKHLGWEGRMPTMREWLMERGLLMPGATKPSDPKRAVDAALRQTRTARSSAVFEQLARSVTLVQCSDPAFEKLRRVLTGWFPLSRRT